MVGFHEGIHHKDGEQAQAEDQHGHAGGPAAAPAEGKSAVKHIGQGGPDKKADDLLGIAAEGRSEYWFCPEQARGDAQRIEREGGQHGKGVDSVQQGEGGHVL